MKCGSGSATLPFLMTAHSNGKPDSAGVIYSHPILPNNLVYKNFTSKVCIGMERVPYPGQWSHGGFRNFLLLPREKALKIFTKEIRWEVNSWRFHKADTSAVDSDPDASINKPKIKKVPVIKLWYFVTSFWLFIYENLCKCTFKSNKQKNLDKTTYLLSASCQPMTKTHYPDPNP